MFHDGDRLAARLGHFAWFLHRLDRVAFVAATCPPFADRRGHARGLSGPARGAGGWAGSGCSDRSARESRIRLEGGRVKAKTQDVVVGLRAAPLDVAFACVDAPVENRASRVENRAVGVEERTGSVDIRRAGVDGLWAASDSHRCSNSGPRRRTP